MISLRSADFGDEHDVQVKVPGGLYYLGSLNKYQLEELAQDLDIMAEQVAEMLEDVE